MLYHESPEYVRKFYERKELVKDYFEKRFGTPIGKVQHERQVLFVYSQLIKFKSRKILELAIGPARIAANVRIPYAACIGIDTNEIMLKKAKNILKENQNDLWGLICADAFNLPFQDGYFDCVYTFRFIRHFNRQQRSKIFSEVKRILKKGGFLIFDAPNTRLLTIRLKSEEIIYDQYWKREELISELVSEGFSPLKIVGNLRYYWLQKYISRLRYFKLEKTAVNLIKLIEDSNMTKKLIRSDPWEWLVLCQKL